MSDTDKIIAQLEKIAEGQKKPLTSALKLFTETSLVAMKLNDGESLKIKRALAADIDSAEMFLQLSAGERDEFCKQLLDD